MTNVVRIEPTPMVLFASIDADPGFSIKLCNEASLFKAVQESLFLGPDQLNSEQLAEVADAVEKLKDAGNIAYEDGWLCLCTGMADVTAFLMQKIGEAKDEEEYADRERFKMMEERNEARARFKTLQIALVDALGEKVLEIAGKVAA